MSKKARKRSLADNEARCVTCSIRVSPRKLNDVAASIRGMKVDKALAELTFSRRRIAGTIKKTLESAIANAENNQGADVDELKITTITVDDGPRMKRISPRAKGRADRIVKRTSHITVHVGDGRGASKAE